MEALTKMHKQTLCIGHARQFGVTATMELLAKAYPMLGGFDQYDALQLYKAARELSIKSTLSVEEALNHFVQVMQAKRIDSETLIPFIVVDSLQYEQLYYAYFEKLWAPSKHHNSAQGPTFKEKKARRRAASRSRKINRKWQN